MKKITLVAILLSLVAGAPSPSAADETAAGVAVVESLHAALLDIMQRSESLGYRGRFDTISPVLAQSFDFDTIARIVTGRAWKDADEARQAEFIDVFAKLSAATYASNFSSYDGERFETVSSEPKRGNVLVKTVLVKADGDTVSLDYLLRESDGAWRIVNVIADGVSDLSLKRADYTAVIKNDGFNSLITQLNGKVADYAQSER